MAREKLSITLRPSVIYMLDSARSSEGKISYQIERMVIQQAQRRYRDSGAVQRGNDFERFCKVFGYQPRTLTGKDQVIVPEVHYQVDPVLNQWRVVGWPKWHPLVITRSRVDEDPEHYNFMYQIGWILDPHAGKGIDFRTYEHQQENSGRTALD